jgi:glycosyltransferase involved in cell wall biosynthesis
MEEAVKADVVHDHGLWMWPNAYAREAAVAVGKPLVISPRGMLEPWSLNRSKLRKAFAWWLFEKNNLQSAMLFHATAASEETSIRNIVSRRLRRMSADSCLGGDTRERSGAPRSNDHGVRVVVAPNGVDLPDLSRRPPRSILEEKFPRLKGRPWVVFMSRLHPKKGLNVLLRAWAKQRHETTPRDGRNMLVLAGSDLIGYRKAVETMVLELGVSDSVVLTGELLGESKDCLLANAEVFVLPSYSENFGTVVAEAMSWGRPVIASTGTPWKEVVEVGAGWWVKPEEEAVCLALEEAISTTQEELKVIGARGRALVAERYGWTMPAARLVEAYEDILATTRSSRRSKAH